MIALVDDLMDRSRITSAVSDLTFARGVEDCAGADTVVVDLSRHGAEIGALRVLLPAGRIVAFGPHTDDDGADRARMAGADVVLPRSRFFRDPRAAIGDGA